MKVRNFRILNMPASTLILNISAGFLVSEQQRFDHIDFKLFRCQTVLLFELTNNVKIIVVLICNWFDNCSQAKGPLRIDTDLILGCVLINPLTKGFIFIYCRSKHIIADIYTGRNFSIQLINVVLAIQLLLTSDCDRFNKPNVCAYLFINCYW